MVPINKMHLILSRNRCGCRRYDNQTLAFWPEKKTMGVGKDKSKLAAELRLRAEDHIKAEPFGASSSGAYEKTPRLLHELQVHQVELEMQNAELRQARDEIEKSLEKYTDLFEFAPVGYFTLDRDGVIRAANLTGAGLIGIERSGLIGRRFGQFIVATDRAAFTLLHNSTFANRSKQTCEVALLNKGEHPLFVLIEAVAADSGPECRIALIDITGRRQSEETLRENQEELCALTAEISISEERERRRIASELHDQIGQVLVFMRIKLDALHRKVESPEHAGEIRQIIGAVEKTIQEVSSLTFQISPPLLYEIGLEAALEWLGEWAQENYRLKVDFHDDRQPKVLSEEIRSTLFQVIRELLINVAKHAKAKKAVITVKKGDDSLVLQVEDDGVGFDVTKVAKVAIRKKDHIGFGLFNIRQRIGHLRGDFCVESVIGRGTIVTIAVPLPCSDMVESDLHNGRNKEVIP